MTKLEDKLIASVKKGEEERKPEGKKPSQGRSDSAKSSKKGSATNSSRRVSKKAAGNRPKESVKKKPWEDLHPERVWPD